MTLFQLIALIISLTAVVSVVNERLLKLPPVIGPMSAALVLSGALAVAESMGIQIGLDQLAALLTELDFSTVVLDGLLGFLLFAGAMHVPVKLLEEQRRIILLLAVVTTIISTAVVGGLLWSIAGFFGLPLTLLQALAFGALISPTDPVAVLALLKNAGLPKRLEVIISGESLFNDGVGVVLFLIISGMAFGGESYTLTEGTGLLVREIGGGIVAGVLIGSLAYFLLEQSSVPSTHILITLAVASGGYSAALFLETSGAIAMVVAGLIVGNYGLKETMDRSERVRVSDFWGLIDDVLNAVLFVLIGLHVLIVPTGSGWGIAISAILVTLSGRLIGVLVPVVTLKPHRRHFDMVWWDLVALLTWGGLRGGVSVALALSLPEGETRNAMLEMTYAIVLFSILVQGLTMSRLFGKKSLREMSERAKEV